MKKTLLRKGIGMLACIAMIASTTGCATKQETQEPIKTETENVSTETENVSTATDENLTEEPITISWYGQNPPYEDGSWGQQTFESQFNVKLNIVRAESADELSTLIASGEIPDVMFLSSIEELGTYQSLGVLSSFSEDDIKENMPQYYEMCTANDPRFFSYSMIDGKDYGIAIRNVVGNIAKAAVIRADWLKNCGISKVPETLEELETVFDAFTNSDPDKNGVKDTYALSSGSDKENGKRFFSSIFGAYGINPFCWTIQNDKQVFGFATDECKEALKLLNRWYQNGYIDPEFVSDECRTSGTDIAYKFANGKIGFADGFGYDDYEWDNDGHVNAKWVAANEEWQDFFTANADDEEAMYSTSVTTDFDDSKIDPYYIVMEKLVGPAGEASGYYAGSNASGYICLGANVQNDTAKMKKIMNILEQQVTDPEIAINHYAQEGYMWEWNKDKSERVWIENYSDKEGYNAQGQIMGNGKCLWPMYASNEDFLALISGARMDQRYKSDLPVYQKMNVIMDTVKVSLPTAVEQPDLTYQYPLEYIVAAIRGDVDIDSTWDATIQKWYDNGGTKLTEEANEWYLGTK